MTPMTLLAILAGASFGLWSLVMSLTGLRAGGIAFMLLAGTLAVTGPWFLLIRPGPFLAAGHDTRAALAAGFCAACLNGVGMICLPALLDAAPEVVGTRMLVLNLAVVGVVAGWTIAFGEQALTWSKMLGIALAVIAVWLLGR